MAINIFSRFSSHNCTDDLPDGGPEPYMKKHRVYHPLLFAAYPIVFLYVYNADQIRSPIRTIAPLVVTLSLTALSWFLLTRLTKDIDKGGVLVSLFLFLLFLYSHVQKLFWNFTFTLHTITVGRNLILFPLWIALGILGPFLVIKGKKSPVQFSRVLNVISLCLIALPLFLFLRYELFRDRDATASLGLEGFILSSPPNPRDIYYIIFDRYADGQTLNDVYGFDNGPFYRELKKRGFYVADSSRANYTRTFLSLASSLNMTYLSFLAQKHGTSRTDIRPIIHMIEHHRVGKMLRSVGYSYIHIGSWYEPTSSNRSADINHNPFFTAEFTMVLLRTTALYPVLAKLGVMEDNRLYARIALSQFEKAPEIPKLAQPTFAFVHFLLPHFPYIFDRDGYVRTGTSDDGQYNRDKYLDQMVFTNGKILDMVDTILARSDTKPIIILQADEGPFPETATGNLTAFDWRAASRAELRQKTGILNAYLFPDMPDSMLYRSITPVNTFRLLFNFYFGANQPLLPDSIFLTSFENRPYDYVDVTGIVVPTDSSH